MPTPNVVRQQAQYRALFDKNAEARKAQGYTTRPDSCRNCVHLEHDVRQVSNGIHDRYGTHPEKFNPHCGIGGFAVVPTAKCSSHQPTASPSQSGALSDNSST